MARDLGRVAASRASRRQELEPQLTAALERLLRAGSTFGEIKLTRLVAEAAVSRTVFYSYFDSKTDVLRARFAQTLAELAEQAGPAPAAAGEATYDDLRTRASACTAVYRDSRPIVDAVYEAAASEPDVRADLQLAVARAERALAATLARGQADGWARADLEPTSVARWLVALAERGLAEVAALADDDDLEGVVGAMVDVCWLTVGASAGS